MEKQKAEGHTNNIDNKRRDKVHSRFKNHIFLRSGRNFPGYSKPLGWEEMRNAENNLINFILRIGIDNEYLLRESRKVYSGIEKIEYYVNRNHNIEKVTADWYHFLTLDYFNPEWVDITYRTAKLGVFLTQLYDKLNRGVDKNAIMQDLYIHERAAKTDPLSLEKPRFGSMLDLQGHCIKLRHQGKYSDEVIQNFYAQYSAKYFKR